MKTFVQLCLAGLLAATLAIFPVAAWAAGPPDSAPNTATKKGSGSAKEDIKNIGPAFRQAGRETKEAAKGAGHNIKKGARDAKEDLKHPKGSKKGPPPPGKKE